MSAGGSGALRRLAASLVALGRIRLELLAIEVREETSRIARLLFWAVLGALMSGFALLAIAVAVTVGLWDTSHRLTALVGVCIVLGGLAALAIWRLRELAATPSTLLVSSIGELRRDETALRDAAAVPSPPSGRS